MEPLQRQTTVMLSSLLGDAVPFDFLVAASKDADNEVRTLVCVALQGLASRANPDWLIPLLRDRDSHVRHAAEEALLAYGNRVPFEPVLQALIARGVDYENPLAEVLGTLKEDFPRSALEDLVESHGEVAAVILGELGAAAPTDLLDALLAVPYRESTHAMRFEALRAAKKLKMPALASRLAAIMRDERDYSRFSAAAALGAIGDSRYMPEILALLPVADPLNFTDVAEGLAGFGEQMPVDAMVDYALAYPADGDNYLFDLIDAFRFAGKHTPYDFLVSYIQDTARAPEARGAAAQVLAAFAGGGLATKGQYDATLPLLIDLLRSGGDPLFRHYVAASLGLIKDPLALYPLMAVASAGDEDGLVAINAAYGLYQLAMAGLHAPVEMWKTVLDHTADMRRKYAVLALGSRNDAPSQLLLDYIGDPHLKDLVHQQLLRHPPSNALDLAQSQLAILAQADDDPLSLAARKALASLGGSSN